MKATVVRTLTILIILATAIGCDQITKNIVRQKIGYADEISMIDHHFTLTRIENPGAFLSLGDHLPAPVRTILLTIIPLIVLICALGYLMTKRNLTNLTILALCFVVGGGIGNIYDRVIYGSVTDFMHIDFVLFQTGIFNMADVSIMIGVFIVLFEFYNDRTPLRFSRTPPAENENGSAAS
jgi:signal peptidase II